MYRIAMLGVLLCLAVLLNACSASEDAPPQDPVAGEQIDYRDSTGATDVMNAYEESMVEAINKNRFSLVAGLLDPEGPLYKEQENLVRHLSGLNIKEKLINFQIMNIQKINGQYKFYIVEKIGIYYPEGKSTVNEYQWIYTVTQHPATSAFKVFSIERWE
ncbi:TcaA NTF2-like domain-containing protein [Paenibacillus sp. GCM10023250]|uniref:TcaA NTF2-like domain-containing protein n=1 Tax=Paenibacillus sp. GCM10023250 TaxID=3252648 RepID=UPI003621833C